MIRVDESDPVGELEPSFPYRDVTIKRGVDIKESFELLAEIGRGKFGTVYKCREKASGLELAAKKVPVKKREERRTVEREVDVMRRLRHPRLIQLYDAYDSGSFMYVVLELITGGELFERVIDDDFVLTEKACTVFMRQICEGIEFVHQQNILHLDMKPENILCLTKTGNRIKIIDFGLARLFDPEKKLQVLFGTPEFVAPEVVNFDQIGFGTDMWSVGVICYVLLSGLSPFMGETDIETMANVTVAKYDFDDEAFNEISDDAKDFIRKLLIKDKESRMTASQCVRHSWVAKKPPKMKPPLEKSKSKDAPKKIQEMSVSPVEELDMTKDNLRLFVERWSEHPNSPYIFDKSNHEITHCLSNSTKHSAQIPDYENSVAGCSPSPCGSLNSSPDIIDDDCVINKYVNNYDNEKTKSKLSVSSLERRASDSSCFIHKKADICLRVNLAEEIKKLSDHLFLLSTMNTEIVNNTIEDGSNKNGAASNVNKTESEKQSIQFTENNVTSNKNKSTIQNTSVKSSFISETNKTNSDNVTSNKSKSTVQNTSVKSSFMGETNKINGDNVTSNKSKSIMQNTSVKSSFLGETNKINGDNVTSNKSKSTVQTTSVKSSFVAESNKANDEIVTSNLPWTKPSRTKFKMTGMNRDVPILDKKETSFGNEFNRRRESINKFISSNSEENENYTPKGETNAQSSDISTRKEEMTNNVQTAGMNTVKSKEFTSSTSSVKFNSTSKDSRSIKTSIQSDSKAASSTSKNKLVTKLDTNFHTSNGLSLSNGVTEVDSTKRHFYKNDTEDSISDNAHRTKDLLLSLLDQWDESQTQPQQHKHNVRHKSVSMEWSETDSLAQKSLNSLNTFFTRQTSTSETVKKKHENLVKANGFK